MSARARNQMAPLFLQAAVVRPAVLQPAAATLANDLAECVPAATFDAACFLLCVYHASAAHSWVCLLTSPFAAPLPPTSPIALLCRHMDFIWWVAATGGILKEVESAARKNEIDRRALEHEDGQTRGSSKI